MDRSLLGQSPKKSGFAVSISTNETIATTRRKTQIGILEENTTAERNVKIFNM